MSFDKTERLIAFVKLGRPRFLLGGLLFYGLGAALAQAQGSSIDWRRFGFGQLIVTSAQWMTQYANDFFDLEADRANRTPTRWSGGSRILVGGAVAPRAALIAALALGASAIVSASVLAIASDSPPGVLPLALVIIALSWCYSAPPVRLLSRGLGELTTALVVTLLTPLLGFYLQRASLAPILFLACAPLCGLQCAMLLTIELPDAAGDAAQGKRTLVVRKGAAWGARVAAGLVTGSFGLLPILFVFGLPLPLAACAALPAPLALWHVSRLVRGAFRDPGSWESLAFCSVLLLASTAVCELVGAGWTIALAH